MSLLSGLRLLRTSAVTFHQLRQLSCQRTARLCSQALSAHSNHHRLAYPNNLSPRDGLVCTQHIRHYAKKAKKEKKDKGGKGGKAAKPKVSLNKEELNEVINYDKMCLQMDRVVDHLKSDFIEQLSIRTSSGVLNQLPVDTPDGRFPLIQLGQIAQKTPQLIVVNLAVNPQYINAVKLAISESGMNLNPQQDGTTLFVPLPKVTKEHRENLVKNAKLICAKAKDKLRDVHNTFARDLKKNKDNHSSDLVRSIQEYIDQTMRDYAVQADDLLALKQKELLQEK